MRDNYISWNDYFMELAILAAKRSKDSTHQVGSCIVDNQNNILSLGYNGMPKGIKDTKDIWSDEQKHLYVVHSELNAILNAHCDLQNTILYCTLFPCNECAKAIVQAGIKKVVYLNDFKPDRDYMMASKNMLIHAGISIEKYERNK
jgi:dCMP deaminase